MADLHDEKHDEVHEVKHQAVATTKTTQGDEAFQQAMIKEPPKWYGSPIIIPCIMVAYCCSTANGYDGSLFGTLLANDAFMKFFSVDNKGIGAGRSQSYTHLPSFAR